MYFPVFLNNSLKFWDPAHSYDIIILYIISILYPEWTSGFNFFL